MYLVWSVNEQYREYLRFGESTSASANNIAEVHFTKYGYFNQFEIALTILPPKTFLLPKT